MSSIDVDRDTPSIDSREDLQKAIEDLQCEIDALEELMGENVAGLHARISKIDDRLQAFDRRLDELEDDMKVAAASSSSKKASKIDKATEVRRFADRKHGGPAGVTVTSSEVVGAADCSKSRATGLMDEVAGAIDSAETKKPGGPKPKELRLPIGERDVEDVVDELVKAWGDQE